MESWGDLGEGSYRGNQQGEIVFGCEQGSREKSPAWRTAGSQIWCRCQVTFELC